MLFIMMRLVEGTDLRALIASEGTRRAAARGAHRPPGRRRARRRPRARPGAPRRQAGQRAARARPTTSTSATSVSPSAPTRRGGLTRQGSIVARAEYVAPEQILEDRVDALTDVYALGCLLFEALTGEAPFAGVAGGPAMLAHVNEPPPSPPERRPDLPPRLRRRGPARDGQGSGRALPVGGRPRARRRSWPPAAAPGRTRSRVVATGPAAPDRGHARPVARRCGRCRTEPDHAHAPAASPSRRAARSTRSVGLRARHPGGARGLHGRRAERAFDAVSRSTPTKGGVGRHLRV